MRFIVMHKTNAHWETGAPPSRALVERVGAMIGELQQAGVFLDGAGLRPTSEGVRLGFSRGARTIQRGPFAGDHELLEGFTTVQAQSLDDAIAAATRQAAVVDAAETDIRPVTEPWDIGLASEPADATARRYMLLRKATPQSEREGISSSQRAELVRVVDAGTRAEHLVTETMRPSARGRRYRNSTGGVTYVDGPFTETKEMIGGYILVSGVSLDEMDSYVRRYMEIVDTGEVDVRELA
jgi:hypothetical protein